MKKVRLAYWVVTGLFALSMLLTSLPAVFREAGTVDFITNHFGYPEYFVFYSGLVKILGVVAIIIPGFPRLKEWAYAGLAFDLISVCYSSIAVGDPVAQGAPMLVYFALFAGSYFLYHKRNNAGASAIRANAIQQ